MNLKTKLKTAKKELFKEIFRKKEEISRKMQRKKEEFSRKIQAIRTSEAISAWQNKIDMVNIKLFTEDDDQTCSVLNKKLQLFNG